MASGSGNGSTYPQFKMALPSFSTHHPEPIETDVFFEPRYAFASHAHGAKSSSRHPILPSMQLFRLEVCISTKHLPISMPGDERHLLDREARLEKPARAFMPQIMEM